MVEEKSMLLCCFDSDLQWVMKEGLAGVVDLVLGIIRLWGEQVL